MINPDQVTEYDIHQFCAEASDLGWKVFPAKVDTTIGNKMPFLMVSRDDAKCVYRQANGCVTLTVYND